jgi:hypothetical protein
MPRITYGPTSKRPKPPGGYLDLMQEVISTHGVPLSLYADRHSIFHTTREPTIIEQLKDVVP